MLQTSYKYDYNYNNLKNEDKKSKNNRSVTRVVFTYLIVIIIMGTCIVAYLSQTLTITHLSYKVNELQNELQKIDKENHELSLELARATSLSKIEKIARNELHMVEPEKTEIIVLNNNDTDISNKNKNSDRDKIFFLHFIDKIIDRIGTVKAGSRK
ncbi:Septum formation initiator [Halothermothrix orenii H 168]|uniref:Septum formation initiator n=1 Tax=Halothermothrix orenii (strain H 168 / OCM 544 / DSM 9562) TaxID=373903 RepID=B8CWI9_HALOH|nr:Septum formation initiator [Halothermothrix orenii H 168]